MYNFVARSGVSCGGELTTLILTKPLTSRALSVRQWYNLLTIMHRS